MIPKIDCFKRLNLPQSKCKGIRSHKNCFSSPAPTHKHHTALPWQLYRFGMLKQLKLSRTLEASDTFLAKVSSWCWLWMLDWDSNHRLNTTGKTVQIVNVTVRTTGPTLSYIRLSSRGTTGNTVGFSVHRSSGRERISPWKKPILAPCTSITPCRRRYTRRAPLRMALK